MTDLALALISVRKRENPPRKAPVSAPAPARSTASIPSRFAHLQRAGALLVTSSVPLAPPPVLSHDERCQAAAAEIIRAGKLRRNEPTP